MMQIRSGQWADIADDQAQRFRRRLVQFVESQFGAPAPGSGMRTAEEVADAAIQFADTAGGVTEAQVARIAILLVAVNRLRVPQARVDELRVLLTAPARSADERIADAAAFLGIEG